MKRELTAEQRAKKAARNLAWRRRNPDKVRAYDAKYYDPVKQRIKHKRYYAANAAKRIEAARKWAKENPERVKRNENRARWRRGGMSVAAVEARLAAHAGACECCGARAPGGRYGWNVDHNHATGKVRGILCHNCNTAIGKLGDTLEGVLRAVNYLQRNEE